MQRRSFLRILGATGAAAALPQMASAATTHQVSIQGFKFEPASLAVAAGDTVVFTNNDRAPHTATANDRSWTTPNLRKGQSAEVTVVAGMEGEYFCAIHPNMKGALTGV
ncbi:MAG: copper-binding protein [Rhodobacteraceae bacterium]|nr:copper-binding protein [Paracoccaceae bacterium]